MERCAVCWLTAMPNVMVKRLVHMQNATAASRKEREINPTNSGMATAEPAKTNRAVFTDRAALWCSMRLATSFSFPQIRVLR